MSQDTITQRLDVVRAKAWVMDHEGRVHEDARTCEGAAHGWVDAQGGIGRVEAVDGTLPGAEVLEALDARYPGVRWLAELGLV
ncbi:MAG: hypothetical protein R3B57_06910 [Phycisphaerales bacterium]